MANNKSVLAVYAEYALARGLLFALRRLPEREAESLSRMAARTLGLLVPKLRRVANTNLGFAFPTWAKAQRERTIDGVFHSIARLLFTMARLPDLNCENVRTVIRYDGLENYQRAKERGRGVLVATAHLGNWELSAYAHALMTEPMNVMVRPLDNPKIDRAVEELRGRPGNRLIYKKDAARAVLKALRANEAVGILADQNTSAAEGVFVSFFGQQACANSGFVKLAYHSGAPVVPGFALWEEASRQYVLRFYPEIALTGDVQADTQRIHAVFEQIIREYPDQWMWIHRRWKTRPPGEAFLYE